MILKAGPVYQFYNCDLKQDLAFYVYNIDVNIFMIFSQLFSNKVPQGIGFNFLSMQ